ncbi:MAG: AAA family ATPase [Candidatus Korarchaeota archaeon]|nr:AAA family ATPase [Candidatus Korarchaeota archaeon]NIU83517.1 AAA family ATPase [Candidatus Thorarchaeota archaeon]NIW13782.1 AAA family ATPase [Candidatus Thorarchaeota archaeon]NIW51910.1 AAA family ATPase [Candidatus Korarchaeota archaeon]
MHKSHSTPPFIAIVGMPGSGKSIVVEYLKENGWNVIHFGKLTIKELQKHNLAVTEANEKKVREQLRETYGMGAFAKLLLPEIRKALSKGKTVIDGLYSWSEYKYLREHLDTKLYLLHVFTPKWLRYKRLASRDTRPLSKEEAMKRDFAEIEHLEKGGPIAMADFTIINDGGKEELYAVVEAVISQIISKDRESEKSETN